MSERTIEPGGDEVQRFLEAADAEAPIVMINLLRYREQADYSAAPAEGLDRSPCTGREAYDRYGQAVFPLVSGVGGRVVWAGSVSHALIAPRDEDWDDAILVEYPTPAAFVGMVTSEAYLAVAPHRTAALLDSRLIAAKG